MAFKEKNLTKLIGVFSFKESFKMDFIFNLTKILNFSILSQLRLVTVTFKGTGTVMLTVTVTVAVRGR